MSDTYRPAYVFEKQDVVAARGVAFMRQALAENGQLEDVVRALLADAYGQGWFDYADARNYGVDLYKQATTEYCTCLQQIHTPTCPRSKLTTEENPT